MNADQSWLGATPGEPVPTVGAADLKSVWNVSKNIESQYPGEAVGMCTTLIEKACSAGVDVRAITYRCGMLQLLERLGDDLLTPWKEGGQLKEAVFRVAARLPMVWIAAGVPQSGFPFDVDLFLRELRQESA
jgi:hypothetical protein